MKSRYFYLSFILFLSLNITYQQVHVKNDSGLIVYLSEYGIKQVQKDLIPVIFNNYPIHLPSPGAFEQTIDFIGKLKLNISDLTLTFDNISENQLNIEFIEGSNLINATISDISGSLNFTYNFESGFYNNKANGTIKINGMSAEISSLLCTVNNTRNPGKLGPNIRITSLIIPKSPSLSIDFDAPGRLEMLIKFFFDLVSNSISQSIKDNITKEKVENFNRNITSFMANLELENTYQNITLDYSLNYAPTIKNKTIEISFDANITAENNYTYSGQKYNISHKYYGEAPIYGLLNQYLLDGIFDVLQNQNKLNGFVPSELVQSDYFKLNVEGISKFFTNISKFYNMSDKVDLNISSLSPPLLNFKDEKLKGQFNFTLDFLVRKNDTISSESATKVNFIIDADLGFTIKIAKLEIKIRTITFTEAKVMSSNIGDIDTEKLKSNLNLNINIILFIYSTFKYDFGIFLPRIPGISLNQTSVIPHENYLEFGIIPAPEKVELNNYFFTLDSGKKMEENLLYLIDLANDKINNNYENSSIEDINKKFLK